MYNPEIVKKSGPYETEEGCLSLTGTRPAKRWKSIKVRWQNEKFQERVKTSPAGRPKSSSTSSTTVRGL